MFAGNYRAFKYEGCHVYVTKQFFLLQDRSTSIPGPFPGLGLFSPRPSPKTGKRPWERGWIEFWERPFISETLRRSAKETGKDGMWYSYVTVFLQDEYDGKLARGYSANTERHMWTKVLSLIIISLVTFPTSVGFASLRLSGISLRNFSHPENTVTKHV